MNYELWFFCLCAFIVGRLSTTKVYIGPDEEKYKQAELGFLLTKKN